MTTLTRIGLTREAVIRMTSASRGKATFVPPDDRAPEWIVDILADITDDHDITVDWLCYVSGKPRKTCIPAMAKAVADRRIRIVSRANCQPVTTYRRTEKPWIQAPGERDFSFARRAIAALEPGTVFVPADIAHHDKGPHRAIRYALKAGVVEVVGVTPPNKGVWRKVAR